MAVAKDAEDEKSEKGQRPDKVIFSCLGLFDFFAIDMVCTKGMEARR